MTLFQDYPRPIVDHNVIHKGNMDRMKKAYAAGNILPRKSGFDTKLETVRNVSKGFVNKVGWNEPTNSVKLPLDINLYRLSGY